MTKKNFPFYNLKHGGEVSEAAKYFGKKEKYWLNLSTGIAPWPYPAADTLNQLICDNSWAQLPSYQKLNLLLNQAKIYYQVPANLPIIASSGAQTIIQNLFLSLPELQENNPIYCYHFCYSGYQQALQHVNANRWHYFKNLQNIPCNAIVILANPNNPDAKHYSLVQIKELVEYLTPNGYLILDETFNDCYVNNSIAPIIKNTDRIIVLKSIGKFFGLAGIRVGFALGNEQLLYNIKKQIGPWPLSSISIELALACLKDKKWQSQQIKKIKLANKNHQEIFSETKLKYTQDHNLPFNLINHPNAKEMFVFLGNKQIFVRPYPQANQQFANYLRIGLTKDPQQLRKLHSAITEFSSQ